MKKLLSLAITLALCGSVLSPHALASVKSGTKCSAQGQTKNWQGKKFTCIKSGKKLVWNKGVAFAKPVPAQTPIPTATPTPTPTATSVQKTTDVYSGPSELSDKIDNCKIKEVNLNGPRNGRAGPEGAQISLPSGFPVVKPATQHVGTVKWALIPIEFPDLKGESSFRSRVDSQMELLTEWFFTVSEGKFKVDWSIHNDWVTLPKPSSQYAISNSVNLGDSVVGQALFRDAMASADPIFNFTNIQYVIFLLPKGQSFLKETSQGFPWDQLVIDTNTNEGKVSGFAIPGVFMDQPNKDYWGYWAHEFGHAISLPHIGQSRPPAAMFTGYDLMSSQDGPTRELSGWLRFGAQWLPDERVYCKESKAINMLEVTLVPLNSGEKGFKLVVIPLSSTKALVIESRRDTKFSCQMNPGQNGALAYIYDAALSHGEDFLIPVAPAGRPAVRSPCPAPPMIDSVLRTGDKISLDGYVIENLLSGNFDKIRISKQP
jgi:M6 family metalloprotease-like protein